MKRRLGQCPALRDSRERERLTPIVAPILTAANGVEESAPEKVSAFSSPETSGEQTQRTLVPGRGCRSGGHLHGGSRRHGKELIESVRVVVGDRSSASSQIEKSRKEWNSCNSLQPHPPDSSMPAPYEIQTGFPELKNDLLLRAARGAYLVPSPSESPPPPFG